MANHTINSLELLEINCQWFSLAPECDIPSWLALVIGSIIGGVLAIIFFTWQWKIRKEHREMGIKKLYFDLITLRSKIENFTRVIDDFYEDKINEKELYAKRDNRKYEVDRLSYDYAVYALTMKPGVSRHISLVINSALSEYDLTDKEADYVRNVTMMEQIDLLLDVLKEEYPKPFADAKKETEEASQLFITFENELKKAMKLFDLDDKTKLKKEMESFDHNIKNALKKLGELLNKRY